MGGLNGFKTKTRITTKSTKEKQIEDTKQALQNVIDRKPISSITLSWSEELDRGMDIDYSELGRLSDCLAALEIAKAKLLKENYN